MSEYQITFSSLIRAVKHQWKVLLAALLVLSITGAGTGYWYAGHHTVSANGGADALKAGIADVSPADEQYFSDYYGILSLRRQNIQTYLDTLKGLTPLSDEDTASLKALQKEIDSVHKAYLSPISERLNAADELYIPDACIPKAIERYRNKLASLQRELPGAEAAAEIIKNMDAPVLEDDSTRTYYNALLTRAYNYTSYLIDRDKYSKYLEQLENDPDAVGANAREMAELEGQAAQELEQIEARASACAEELAQAKYLQIINTYSDDGTLSVTVNHTHGAASAQENFLVIWIFCTLCGICIGAFLAVCKEAEAAKRKRGI